DHWRQRIEIDLVDAPIHHTIAYYTEHDQKVQAGIKEAVVEPEIKSANGGVHEDASCNEDKAAMTFRLLPPINCQCHACAKNDHVLERNRQEGICPLLMEHNDIESGHDNRDGEAQCHH